MKTTSIIDEHQDFSCVATYHTTMIVLIVDSREKTLHNNILQLLQRQNPPQKTTELIKVHLQPLELGDVKLIFSKDDSVLRELVFERKTLPDMVSSMHDGRYREQKARLLANVPSQNTTYIIEGDTMCDSVRREAKAVSSAYFNMVFRDDIHVLFTRDVSETALCLLSLCAKMLDKPANYAQGQTVVSGESSGSPSLVNTNSRPKEYTSFLKLKSKKNHNITPENCFILQLAQVPSVSNVIAKNIAKAFPNSGVLIDAMRTCASHKEKLKLLAGIDKVGKAKAAKIIEYMHL